MTSDSIKSGPSRPDARTFFLTPVASGPLADTISRHFPQFNAHRIIESGGVWRGRVRLLDAHARIERGDTIKLYVCPNQGYRYGFSKTYIINETDDWVVAYKEPLITIGMDRSNMHVNMTAGLNDYYGLTDMRTGVQPITRLDYRVSGVCLFSKKKAAERRLFQQMQQRRITKEYRAIVPWGHPVQSKKTMENYITYRDRAYDDPGGKWASTTFVYESSIDQVGHCYHVTTATGRRHQIRYHAAQSIGGLINDERYQSTLSNHPRYTDRHAPIGLIATTLRFMWNGTWIHASLPPYWHHQSIEWITSPPNH